MNKASPVLLTLVPLIYLLTAIGVAALAAYPISQWLSADFGLARIINRITLGLLVLGILPMRRWLDLSAFEMGFTMRMTTFAVQLTKGFALGLIILGIVITTLIALKVRIVLPALIDLPGKLSHELYASLRTGIIVAFLEETLFRGLLFGALLKYGSIRSAVLITAVFYASLHFIHGRGVSVPEKIEWTSGISMIPDALSELFNVTNFDSFLALFFVSVFLTSVRLGTTAGIGYCIGLHAGWVFILRLTKTFTAVSPNTEWGFLIGQYDGVIGYLVAGWLLAWSALFFLFLRPKGNLETPGVKQ